MRAIPAIDLREGRCVQLVGGDYDAEAIRLENPLDVALRWADLGFSHLHIVDLDAATGRGSNADVVRALLRTSGMSAQVGGGIRDDEAIDSWLDAGADCVVVGTRGVADPEWLEVQAERLGRKLILAADVRERRVLTHGWQRELGQGIEGLVASLRRLPLGGLLVTSVEREGRMLGPDVELLAELVRSAPWPIIASGGIGTLDHLRALERGGTAAAVLGMALYTNAIDPTVVAREFRS
jgi:phosphoribosylformimino-5-aminoimidazole carboxamide ribotide isomerase